MSARPFLPEGYFYRLHDFYKPRNRFVPVGGVRSVEDDQPVTFLVDGVEVAVMYDTHAQFWLSAFDINQDKLFKSEGPFPDFQTLMVAARISGYERKVRQ